MRRTATSGQLWRHVSVTCATAILMSGAAVAVPAVASATPVDAQSAGQKQGWTPTSTWVDNADGTVTRTFFPDVTFRRDTTGAWQPVDPSVVAETNPLSWDVASVPGGVRPLRFGRQADRLIALELPAGAVTLRATNLRLGEPEVSATTVSYPLASGETLSFASQPSGLKQTITMPEPKVGQEFRFHLADPQGALGRPVKTADGGVEFDRPVADGLRLALAAPVAYAQQDPTQVVRDADGAAVPSATLQVTASGDGFDVVESLNPNWLAQVHGAVVLDPSLTYVSHNAPAVTDCAVSSQATVIATPDCAAAISQVGADVRWTRRLLVRYDLSDFPTPAQVTAASLALTSDGPGSNVPIQLNEAGAAWTTSATWLTADGTTTWPAGTTGGDPLTPALGSGNLAPNGVSVTLASTALTSLVAKWINGSSPNRGLVIKAVSEAAPGPVSCRSL